jgi:hypothetical protein
VRLIAQHAHAWICGPMARAWCGPGAAPPGFEATVAMGLHDYAWREADARPRLNPETGRPHDFLDYPHERRLELYEEGVDALEELHPYVAELVSRHYTTFGLMARFSDYQTREATRRARLTSELPAALREPRRQQDDLALLKLFDTLSLYVCLGGPRSRPDTLPSWLEPEQWTELPDGSPFTLEWEGDDVLLLEPYPWKGPLELTVPFTDLEGEVFADQAALDAALPGARAGAWTVTLRPVG